MKHKAIVVTGTPGTGKTILARRIAGESGLEYINVKKLISKHKIACGYDKKRKCPVVDVNKLNSVLIMHIDKSKKTAVIDSHLAHYLPKRYVSVCLVCKCELSVLKKRLMARKYSAAKMRENLDAEIFDVCLNEAKECGHKTIIVDTTGC